MGHSIGKQILRIAKGQDFAMSPGTLKKVSSILDMIPEPAAEIGRSATTIEVIKP
jgi:hypothetical protein